MSQWRSALSSPISNLLLLRLRRHLLLEKQCFHHYIKNILRLSQAVSVAKMSSFVEFKFKYKEKKTAKEEKFDKCMENFFSVFNWLTVLLITCLSFFTGITQTSLETWDMSQYCDDERFNQPVTRVTRKWAIITIFILTIIIVAMMSLKMVMFRKITRDMMNLVNFFTGFVLCWDLSYILQNVLSYPIPSYYKIDLLKWYYCCKNCPDQKFTVKLQQLDMDSRGSFPSFLMCASCYTTTFFFLFTCYLDTTKNVLAKIVTLIVPGLVCITYGWLLWKNNENHIEDIIGGSCIGTFLAVYIMKDLLIKNNKFDKFTDDFISVVMTREMELAQLNSTENSSHEGRAHVNEYTINLCSHATSQPLEPLEDHPPPYSTI